MENTQAKYMYKAYGLIVKSSIILPELCEYNGEEDSNITISEASCSFECNIKLKNAVYIPVDKLGQLLICDGKELTFYKYPCCSEDEIRAYILGWGLGVILIQRNILPIHSSAVERDGKCYLFIGESGAGKSTIAHSLIKKGFNFLSDDICAVNYNEEGKPSVLFGCRQSRLWEDSASYLGYNLPFADTSNKRLGKVKYSLVIKTKPFNNPIPLRGVYFISSSLPSYSEDKVILSELKGMEKVSTLVSNLYAPEAISYLKKDINYLNQCIKICSLVRFIKINRVPNLLDPNFMSDLIYKDICRSFKDAV
jgi:hypothetical protein